MNRRSFIAGLLASAAAPALPTPAYTASRASVGWVPYEPITFGYFDQQAVMDEFARIIADQLMLTRTGIEKSACAVVEKNRCASNRLNAILSAASENTDHALHLNAPTFSTSP